MNVYSLLTTRYFIFTGESNLGIGNLQLSNDKFLLNRFFYNNDFYLLSVGLASINSFVGYSFFIDVGSESSWDGDSDIYEYFHSIARENELDAENLFNVLWFVKDNSVSVNYSDSFNGISVEGFCRRVNFNGNYNSLCELTDTEWSEAELLIAYYYASIIANIPSKYIPKRPFKTYKETEGKMSEGLINHFEYNDTNRIERALLFLHAARKSEPLLIRISNYIMMLECLFSNSNEGVSWKIPLRTACFIESTKIERQYVFDFLSVAYDVRSRYVHGNQLSIGTESIDTLKEISNKLDSILRIAFRKILTVELDEFLKPSNEEYYCSLTNNAGVKTREWGNIDCASKIKSYVLKN